MPQALRAGHEARPVTRRGLIILVALAALAAAGCKGKGKDDGAPGKGDTPAVAPDQYLKDTVPENASKAPIVMMVRPAAPKPTGPLPPGASCLTPECHSSYATARHVHGPVSERACDACHGPDAGGHRYPLKRDKIATCTFCHAVVNSAPVQHVANQQGCGVCHNPHAANTKFLLKADSVERLCSSCHNVPLKKFAHNPFAKGQCTLCHSPHQADNRFLLRAGKGAQHCFSCHDDTRRTMASSGRLHEPVKDNCTRCHNAHTTDYPALLSAPADQSCFACHDKLKQKINTSPLLHSAVSSDQRCGNCHDPHGAPFAFLLPERMDKVCLRCHDKPLKAADGRTVSNMKPVLTQSRSLHGPAKYGECSSCHDAHASREHALLTASFPRTFYAPFKADDYTLCWLCHERQIVLQPKTSALTEFRNGQVNMHFLHVNRDPKGRTCKACHTAHGSDLPNHMAAEVPFEGSQWPMPIDYQKTPDGGKCAPGCHAPAAYDRRTPVTNNVRGAQ